MNPDALLNRLDKNRQHLAKWARREGLEAYRVYDRDMPEFPLAIDLYGEALHVQVYERRRPLEDDQLQRLAQAHRVVLIVPDTPPERWWLDGPEAPLQTVLRDELLRVVDTLVQRSLAQRDGRHNRRSRDRLKST